MASLLYEEDTYSPLDHHPKPPETTLVGIHGHARSGKDTSGRILVEERGYERISFAEPLKRLALFVNPIVQTSAYGFTWTLQDVFDELMGAEGLSYDDAWDAAKEIGSTRRFLQKLGEGVREILGEDTWVDAAMAKVDPGGKYAFTDCRFENEAESLRARGGVVVEVTRPGVGPVNEHVSDQRLPDHLIDVTVDNAGTLEGLKVDLLTAVDYLTGS